MMHDCAALLPAAGSGQRLGLGPKAFLPLGQLTLIEHAIAGLRSLATEIIVAVPAELFDSARRLLPGCRVITGAATRQDTVRLLVEQSRSELVLIHDAARPFLPPEVAVHVLEAAARDGAASAALDVADTLVQARDGRAVERVGLKAVQTPQGFQRELLLAAQKAATDLQLAATDEATLVRQHGHPVTLVPGSAWLFKITTGTDLELARAAEPAWTAGRTSRGTPAAG